MDSSLRPIRSSLTPIAINGACCGSLISTADNPPTWPIISPPPGSIDTAPPSASPKPRSTRLPPAPGSAAVICRRSGPLCMTRPKPSDPSRNSKRNGRRCHHRAPSKRCSPALYWMRATHHRLPRDELLDGLQFAHFVAERRLPRADGSLSLARIRQLVREPRQQAHAEYSRPRQRRRLKPQPKNQFRG